MSKFVTALFHLDFTENGAFELFQILYYTDDANLHLQLS